MFKVYLKELLELTRDKKTLIFTILLPTLIMPIIMMGFGALSAKIAKKAIDENLNYSIVGQAYYPELVEVLKKNESITFVKLNTDANIEEAIKSEQIRFCY